MKDESKESEKQPPLVPARAKQGGDIPARWAWVEPTVWTTRMLAALENGVKGGRWFSLIDKVYAPANLAAGLKRVRDNRGGAGVDHQSVEHFERHALKCLDELHQELREGRYRPRPVRRQWIPKPGTNQERPLGIPTVRDRVVQSAMRHVLEPIWEAKFVDQSYGFRPGRSCKDALSRTFPTLDGWIRMRLRSILRRRRRQKGAGRGWSNIRWPNVYFAKLGLFTMTTAREIACRSLQEAH